MCLNENLSFVLNMCIKSIWIIAFPTWTTKKKSAVGTTQLQFFARFNNSRIVFSLFTLFSVLFACFFFYFSYWIIDKGTHLLVHACKRLPPAKLIKKWIPLKIYSVIFSRCCYWSFFSVEIIWNVKGFVFFVIFSHACAHPFFQLFRYLIN